MLLEASVQYYFFSLFLDDYFLLPSNFSRSYETKGVVSFFELRRVWIDGDEYCGLDFNFDWFEDILKSEIKFIASLGDQESDAETQIAIIVFCF